MYQIILLIFIVNIHSSSFFLYLKMILQKKKISLSAQLRLINIFFPPLIDEKFGFLIFINLIKKKLCEYNDL